MEWNEVSPEEMAWRKAFREKKMEWQLGYFQFALKLYGAIHEHETPNLCPRANYEINNLEDGRKTCTVTINDLHASGEGETDKDAKETAARNLIRKLDPSVAALEEYCAQTGYTRPCYSLDIYDIGLRKCKVIVDRMKTLGEAETYKEAQGIASRKMMRLLQRGEDDVLKLDGRDVVKEVGLFVRYNVVPLFVLHHAERLNPVMGPRYSAFCKVGLKVKTIKYAYGDSIMEARQRVALKMLRHLKEYKEKRLAEKEKEKEMEIEMQKAKEKAQEEENEEEEKAEEEKGEEEEEEEKEKENVNTETGQ